MQANTYAVFDCKYEAYILFRFYKLYLVLGSFIKKSNIFTYLQGDYYLRGYMYKI